MVDLGSSHLGPGPPSIYAIAYEFAYLELEKEAL